MKLPLRFLRVLSATFLIACQPARGEPPPNEIPLDDGVVEVLADGEVLEPPAAFTIRNGIAWSATLERDTRGFLRLEFSKIRDASAVEYTVVIKNSRAETVFRYDKARFARRPSFWSGVIAGDTALVEIHAQQPPTGLAFEIARVAVEQAGQQLLSIIGDSDFEKVRDLDPGGLALASAVAKVSFVVGARTKTCTGFLVGDDLLLTNEHCVGSQPICDTAVALFGYEERADGSLTRGPQRDCAAHLAGEFERDFALLRLDASAPGEPGPAPLRLCDRALGANDPLLLIQHPGGEPKQFVRKHCLVKKSSTAGRNGVAAQTDFSHTCDSKRGSSGSPVVDAKGDVVGLHHLGFGVGEFRDVNRAVKIGQILPLAGIAARCSPAANP